MSSEPWNKCGRLSKTKERLRFRFFDAFLCPFLLGGHRNYVIGNLDEKREILFILFSIKGEMKFNKGYIIQKGFSEELGYGYQWTYPCAYEADGKLYVVYTAVVDKNNRRGAVVSVIDL